MFFGTTPSIITQYLQGELKRISPPRLLVPFAGNFAIESTAAAFNSKQRILSTDVSLYSMAIGLALQGTAPPIRLKPELAERYPYVAEQLTPAGIAAGVVFMAEIGQSMRKSSHRHYQSLLADAEQRQKEILDKLASKISAFASIMEAFTFHSMDAVPFLEQNAEPGDMVVYDPPVLLGDYEKMFKPLEESYDYEPIAYTQMDEVVKSAQLQMLAGRGCSVYYRTNNPIERDQVPAGFEQVYSYQYKWGGIYCIYSNDPKATRWVGRFSPVPETLAAYPLITKSDVIGPDSVATMLPVPAKVANHYRLMWVHKAEMTNTGRALLLFVDEKLIGLVTLQESVKFGSDLALIVSDPAAPSSQYSRLSKLVIMLCCTQEVLKWINDESMWEHTGFTTRVFSHSPVSMKYRGIFDLAERREDKAAVHKYTLIYQKRKGLWKTLQDALQDWVKNHAGKSKL